MFQLTLTKETSMLKKLRGLANMNKIRELINKLASSMKNLN